MRDKLYDPVASGAEKPAKADDTAVTSTALENMALSVDSPMLTPSDLSKQSSASFANDTQKDTENVEKPEKEQNAYRR